MDNNIAEGFGRGRNKEFHNFLSFSKGSCTELKLQFYRCFDKNLITKEQVDHCIRISDEEINKIGAFMYYLRKSDFKGQKFR